MIRYTCTSTHWLCVSLSLSHTPCRAAFNAQIVCATILHFCPCVRLHCTYILKRLLSARVYGTHRDRVCVCVWSSLCYAVTITVLGAAYNQPARASDTFFPVVCSLCNTHKTKCGWIKIYIPMFFLCDKQTDVKRRGKEEATKISVCVYIFFLSALNQTLLSLSLYLDYRPPHFIYLYGTMRRFSFFPFDRFTWKANFHTDRPMDTLHLAYDS